MIINISALHQQNSTKIKLYAKKKVEKLAKYHNQIQKIKARLISQKSHRGQDQDCTCELTIHIPRQILEIVDSERDFYKAVDSAINRAKRTLIKSKEKQIS
ncbi:ribosomal subunit interface protein, partial [Candidatus Curtissbacteria bacterium RBG_13_35_7]